MCPEKVVKYKALKSIAHNYSHSFVSYTNYVDDGFVIDDLKQIVRKAEGEKICVWWVPEHPQIPQLTQRILRSIEYYKRNLPKFVADMGSDIVAIREFRTEIYLKSNKQMAVEGHIVDGRGRAYVCPVFDF